ncbi:MAG: dihydropteroate synthase [Bacteriovoracaceae bacterium]
MKVLSILNLTPDSFSDGGEHNREEALEATIKQQKKFGVSHFDFGAESTAPFNNEIDHLQELSRFEGTLYPLVQKKIFEKNDVFSIDTYKPATFQRVYQFLREFYPHNKIWWNDVSGVLDKKSLEIIQNVSHENFHYIFSFTFVDEKKNTSRHMEYTKTDLSIEELIKEGQDSFQRALGILSPYLNKDQIIFDPCFGFSKTKEQNLDLLERADELFYNISSEIPVLIGISRKSFLRKMFDDTQLDKTQMNELCDFYQMRAASRFGLLKKFKRDIILRTHKAHVFNKLLST